MQNHQNVLELLKSRKNKGVTKHDFYSGMHFNECVRILRESGHKVILVEKMYPDNIPQRRWWGRYVLMGKE